jgi:hypothetical protein
LAGLSIAIALPSLRLGPARHGEPWLAYALAFLSILALILSGMPDDERSRVIAGWVGLAAVIAAVTWTARGSLLRRGVLGDRRHRRGGAGKSVGPGLSQGAHRMMKLANFLRRIPPIVLFSVLGMVQMMLIAPIA